MLRSGPWSQWPGMVSTTGDREGLWGTNVNKHDVSNDLKRLLDTSLIYSYYITVELDFLSLN